MWELKPKFQDIWSDKQVLIDDWRTTPTEGVSDIMIQNGKNTELRVERWSKQSCPSD